MKPTSLQRKILENKQAGRRWDFGRVLGVPNDGWDSALNACRAAGWIEGRTESSGFGWYEITETGRAVLEVSA